MLFRNSMSIAQKLMPIENSIVHKKKCFIALYVDELYETPTCHKVDVRRISTQSVTPVLLKHSWNYWCIFAVSITFDRPIFRAWQGPRSSKKIKLNNGKLKFLHTFKAHHRILSQILCKNTKFQINRIKNKDAIRPCGRGALHPRGVKNRDHWPSWWHVQ